MTELMNATHLRELARRHSDVEIALPKTVAVMRWTTDEATGRPVSYWTLAEQHEGHCLPTLC